MIFTQTGLKDCFVIEPSIIKDARGYFFESFHQKKFQDATGYELNFVQDNQSLSNYGVVRGLHIQKGKFAQAKLVRVLAGKILDVAVDVRENSLTRGQHFSIELSEENKKQLYIPTGFLHGFSVLSEKAVVYYKCSTFYDKDSEDGIFPLDTDLNIDWKVPKERMTLSDKDLNAKPFSEFNPI